MISEGLRMMICSNLVLHRGERELIGSGIADNVRSVGDLAHVHSCLVQLLWCSQSAFMQSDQSDCLEDSANVDFELSCG